MRINLNKRNRRLEKISEQDVLIFPDREERVEEINFDVRMLYTSRNVKNKSILTRKRFPTKTEAIAYFIPDYLGVITPNSEGEVYNSKLMRKSK
jgi:hypothetical protein